MVEGSEESRKQAGKARKMLCGAAATLYRNPAPPFNETGIWFV